MQSYRIYVTVADGNMRPLFIRGQEVRMLKNLFLICLVLILSGCITAEKLESFSNDKLAIYRQFHRGEGLYNSEMRKRRQIAIDNHPEWPEKNKQEILGGFISIGMTEEQVKASWGKPDKINRTITSSGKQEQWIYGYREGFGGGTMYWLPKEYIYFENGILTSIQN